jgi:hypothetical protein
MSTNKITTLSIEDDAVTQAKIAIDAVGTSELLNDAVTQDKILNDAVTEDKILNDAVTTGKILDSAVTTGKINFGHDDLDGFLTNEHIDWTTDQSSSIHFGNLPALALTTVQTAANQTAHLALTTQEGDVVVRSDENKSYIHNAGTAGTMNDFTLLSTPTDSVLSVNGQTGAVTIETFISGTKMSFYQASAPTGWTQDFTNGDAALRVVNTALTTLTSTDTLDTTKFYKIKELGNTMFTAFGAGTNIVGVSFKPIQTTWTGSGKLTIGSGGASGGTTGFSSAHTHSHTGSGGSHTLTQTQMPSHRHVSLRGGNTGSTASGWTTVNSSLGPNGFGGGTDDDDWGSSYTTYIGGNSSNGAQSQGSTSSHSHSVTVNSATISAYKYIDVIVCSKD